MPQKSLLNIYNDFILLPGIWIKINAPATKVRRIYRLFSVCLSQLLTFDSGIHLESFCDDLLNDRSRSTSNRSIEVLGRMTGMDGLWQSHLLTCVWFHIHKGTFIIISIIGKYYFYLRLDWIEWMRGRRGSYTLHQLVGVVVDRTRWIELLLLLLKGIWGMIKIWERNFYGVRIRIYCSINVMWMRWNGWLRYQMVIANPMSWRTEEEGL